MADNLRQQITANVVDVIKNIDDPRPVLVTAEPFEVSELAITQFPAVLITATREERETVTMGGVNSGRRSGTIFFSLRGYVRGTELDRRRNDLIEAIEEALDSDRYRQLQIGSTVYGVFDSQITTIEIIERLPPLAEITLEYQVRYSYQRTTT